MNTAWQSRTLSECANICLQSFNGCIARSSRLTPREQSAIEDQRGRFSIWSSNIGIFAEAGGSLDYHLRDARDIQRLLRRLLRTLNNHVQRYLSQLKTTRPAKDYPYQPSSLTDDLAPIVSDMAREISLMHQLSGIIRKASREAQNLGVPAAFKLRDGDGKNIEQLFVEVFAWTNIRHKFPDCAETIQKRLAAAMLLRRKFVLYRHSLQQNSLPLPRISNAREKAVLPLRNEDAVNTEGIPHPSQSASGTTKICPYCCCALPSSVVTDNQKFMHHVLCDTGPYVCLSNNCDTADKLYSNSEDWLDHMRQHNLRWRCTSKSHGILVFNSRDEYEGHMRSKHKITESQLRILARRSSQSSGPIFQCCPLCGESLETGLEEHVASHLRYLALKSLPFTADGTVSKEILGNPGTDGFWARGTIEDDDDESLLGIESGPVDDYTVPVMRNPARYESRLEKSAKKPLFGAASDPGYSSLAATTYNSSQTDSTKLAPSDHKHSPIPLKADSEAARSRRKERLPGDLHARPSRSSIIRRRPFFDQPSEEVKQKEGKEGDVEEQLPPPVRQARRQPTSQGRRARSPISPSNFYDRDENNYYRSRRPPPPKKNQLKLSRKSETTASDMFQDRPSRSLDLSEPQDALPPPEHEVHDSTEETEVTPERSQSSRTSTRPSVSHQSSSRPAPRTLMLVRGSRRILVREPPGFTVGDKTKEVVTPDLEQIQNSRSSTRSLVSYDGLYMSEPWTIVERSPRRRRSIFSDSIGPSDTRDTKQRPRSAEGTQGSDSHARENADDTMPTRDAGALVRRKSPSNYTMNSIDSSSDRNSRSRTGYSASTTATSQPGEDEHDKIAMSLNGATLGFANDSVEGRRITVRTGEDRTVTLDVVGERSYSDQDGKYEPYSRSSDYYF